MASDLAPIALFTYRRPNHTRRVLESLSRNAEARDSDLIVYVDGAKNDDDPNLIDAVYRVVDACRGFKSVEINSAPENLGLSRSITEGVGAVMADYGKAIVLEDDIVVSRFFLEYMNSGLDLYEEDDRVASIHGYRYPVSNRLPSTYFLRGADCWGWATWERAWSGYRSNGDELLSEVLSSGAIDDFDFGGFGGYVDMLREQIAGRNDSWAVRWYASTFLAGQFTLYPGSSLVRNIGLDSTGEHSGTTSAFDTPTHEGPIDMTRIPVTESAEARLAFTEFFRNSRSQSLMHRLRRLVRHRPTPGLAL